MKKVLVILGILGMILVGLGEAQAGLIIDTGPGFGTAWPLHINRWLAGRFTLNQPYTITSIQGHMSGGGTGETLRLTLYGSLGSIPDTSDEIFSQQFWVYGSPYPNYDWYGTSLNLDLDAGTYWAAWEVLPSDPWGYAGAWPEGASSPLSAYAISYDQGTSWSSHPTMNSGLRVYGEEIIPEPASLSLLGLGLLGLVFRKRKSA